VLYQPRHVSAQMAYKALLANPSGLSWYAWARAAGLYSSQLRYAQPLLREVFQTANGEPLIWKNSLGIYKLAQNQPELDFYLAWRCKTIDTMLRRIEQSMLAGKMKFKTTKTTRKALRDMKKVRDDFDALVANF
jgi:hypothetical protein